MEGDSKEMEQESVTAIETKRDSKEIEQKSVTPSKGMRESRELNEIEQESITTIERDGEECSISKLPQEMKEMIFAMLPFESICSSLTVCKEWNCILSSQSFLSSLPNQNPWLLICGREENGNWNCVAYCFPTLKWRELSLSFLPDPQLFALKHYNTEIEDSPPHISLRDLSMAGQGLMLFRETPMGQLNVCNPLLRSYAEIDMDLTNKFVHIVQGRNKEPYLVVWSNSAKFSFEIYHYFQHSWTTKFQFAGEKRSDIFDNEMIECNGVLFWKGITPASIIGYKIQNEGFISPVTVAPLPLQMVHDMHMYNLSIFQNLYLHYFSMVSYGSSVLVVTTFQEEPSAVNIPGAWSSQAQPWYVGNHPLAMVMATRPVPTMFNNWKSSVGQKGIVIWELFPEEEDELIWNWKEFARIRPHSLPQYFDEMICSHLKCICVGDYLCFSGLLPAGSPPVFALNLREGFWQLLPPSNIKQTVEFVKLMSFAPKFNYQFFQK
ncbi:hypothetical protein SUGI_0346210 [Cryptomeria japonica]|nr:hypothetical protein SUGI_0346210 [Cryptomeria japonica]